MSPNLHRVCKTSEIAEEEARKVVVENHIIAIFNVENSFYAIDDTCTHGQASLSEGFVEGDQIECPLHAGRFHIPTGKAVAPPVTEPVRSYRVHMIDDEIYVELPTE